MNAINVPITVPGCRIKGMLCDSYPPEDLDQDILQVSLPNGITVDVGWYPDGDPDGEFKVVVYRKYWSNQLCAPFVTRGPREVAKAVEKLVVQYSKWPSFLTPTIRIVGNWGNWSDASCQKSGSYGTSSNCNTTETEDFQLAAGR